MSGSTGPTSDADGPDKESVLEQLTLRRLEDDELRVVLYTPLPEAETPRKLEALR